MLNERLGHRNDTSGPKESCEVVLEYCLVKRSDMATLSKYIIISLAGIQLLKEIFQITQVSELKKKPLYVYWVSLFSFFFCCF